MEQVLIDNQNFNIIKKIDFDGCTYFYLQNDTNEDLLIQKLIDDNLVNLDNEDEVKKALLLFSNQYIKDAQN